MVREHGQPSKPRESQRPGEQHLVAGVLAAAVLLLLLLLAHRRRHPRRSSVATSQRTTHAAKQYVATSIRPHAKRAVDMSASITLRRVAGWVIERLVLPSG